MRQRFARQRDIHQRVGRHFQTVQRQPIAAMRIIDDFLARHAVVAQLRRLDNHQCGRAVIGDTGQHIIRLSRMRNQIFRAAQHQRIAFCRCRAANIFQIPIGVVFAHCQHGNFATCQLRQQRFFLRRRAAF